MEKQNEALRLKALAEKKYTSSPSLLKSALKYAKRAHRLYPTLDGVSELLTAFQILSAASAATPPDWYKILQTEPFSHINLIKKQYRKLALTLHPDKNPFAACEEAFKHVAEGFRVLSDKVARKEYDTKLRMTMQAAATRGGGLGDMAEAEGFWTSCIACRLMHRFDRKYLGHNLMCPSCKKSFKALEVNDNSEENDVKEDVTEIRSSARIKAKGGGLRWKMSRVGEVFERSIPENGESGCDNGVGSRVSDDIRISRLKRVSDKPKLKRVETGEEGITLAEMQMRAKKKVKEEKMRLRVKEKRKESEKVKEFSKDKKRRRVCDDVDLEIMAVQDSDFHDFDKDRVEKSFKKGQVWAVNEDDDGMPRHYGLIDDVSVYPFKVRLSWLVPDEVSLSWEKTRVHVSCGRFKVAKTDIMYAVNIFSHLVNAERAGKEVYRIYPKKGSVWALFNEEALQNSDKKCYDIVVCLGSYDETYGLSIGYLGKVDGFKTVFKRREIGSHAVKWLEKVDFRLFSHQIPARKLSGEEARDLSSDCWELDPASLPPELA